MITWRQMDNLETIICLAKLENIQITPEIKLNNIKQFSEFWNMQSFWKTRFPVVTVDKVGEK